MILGVDHLQISAPRMRDAGAFLGELGYSQQFDGPNFLKGKIENEIYRDSSKNMIWFKADDGSMPVELINSHSYSGVIGCSVYGSLLQNNQRPTASRSENETTFPEALMTRFGIWPAGAQKMAEKVILAGMRAYTHTPDESLKFWTEGLGFRVIEDSADGACLLAMGRRPVGSGLFLILTPQEEIRGPFLFIDDPGCLMLSFLTTNINHDMARLSKNNGQTRNTTLDLRVNNRALTVGFATGPGGENVELIQPARL